MAKFKAGDKIVCITLRDTINSKLYTESLECRKIYTCQLYYNQDIYKSNKSDVCLHVVVKSFGDKIRQAKYPETWFVSLSEYRKMKLKKINEIYS